MKRRQFLTGAAVSALTAGLSLALLTYDAPAFGFGDFGRLGSNGSATSSGGGGGGSTGKILLVDASSKILQTDTSSKLCLAGGC